MRAFSVAVAWKEAYARSLQGVVEVRDSDVQELLQKKKKQATKQQPQGSKEANVGDLIEVLSEKLRPMDEKDGGTRFVEAIYLYGIRLHNDRLLQSIVTGAVDGCPRLVAKTHFACHAYGEVVLTIKSVTGELAIVYATSSDSIDNVKQKTQVLWLHFAVYSTGSLLRASRPARAWRVPLGGCS